jgi:Kef-type K+ transport system membrane component KefB
MENVWFTAALWLGLAFLASVISIRIAISVALIEIVVGAVAGNTIGLRLNDWVNFLAGFGAILLTFLAGSEIDPRVIKKHLGPSLGIGLVSFLAPYLGCLLFARYGLGWNWATSTNRRYRTLHDLGRRGVRGHDRDRFQQDRIRQDHPRGLLRHRPRHGSCARHRLRAL